MNIGKPLRTIYVPLPEEEPKAIPVPEWPKERPAEKPVEAPFWPVKEPAKQE